MILPCAIILSKAPICVASTDEAAEVLALVFVLIPLSKPRKAESLPLVLAFWASPAAVLSPAPGILALAPPIAAPSPPPPPPPVTIMEDFLRANMSCFFFSDSPDSKSDRLLALLAPPELGIIGIGEPLAVVGGALGDDGNIGAWGVEGTGGGGGAGGCGAVNCGGVGGAISFFGGCGVFCVEARELSPVTEGVLADLSNSSFFSCNFSSLSTLSRSFTASGEERSR